MELYHIVITILALVWIGGGPLLYLTNLSKVKRTPQKVVLLVLAGPVTWAVIPIVKVSDWIILNLFKWLYKE